MRLSEKRWIVYPMMEKSKKSFVVFIIALLGMFLVVAILRGEASDYVRKLLSHTHHHSPPQPATSAESVEDAKGPEEQAPSQPSKNESPLRAPDDGDAY